MGAVQLLSNDSGVGCGGVDYGIFRSHAFCGWGRSAGAVCRSIPSGGMTAIDVGDVRLAIACVEIAQ